MSDDERYFSHSMGDDERDDGIRESDIRQQIARNLDTIEKEHNRKDKDFQVYTGHAGIALTYWKAYVTAGSKEDRSRYLERARYYVDLALKRLKEHPSSRISFLAGPAGPHAIAAVITREMGDKDASDAHIEAVMKVPEKFASGDSYEILYGRAGFLTAVQFVNGHIEGAIPDSFVRPIWEEIVDAGKNYGSRISPLMYAWHKKEYLGGAHGLSGIMHVLLQFPKYIKRDSERLILGTLDYLLSLQFRDGNFPSSVGKKHADLVQWCHGAPGFVHLFVAASKKYGDSRYMDAAVNGAECIWRQGITRKGPGLCHGVGGNGYSFLCLYRATGDKKYLRRAAAFADFSRSRRYVEEHRPADSPLSLFEDLGGITALMTDLLRPDGAYFPGYDTPVPPSSGDALPDRAATSSSSDSSSSGS